MTRFLYLHGFASGPASRKASFFRDRFRQRSIDLQVPALDEGDFERLTLSAQLALIARLAAGDPVTLIGSSLGGYLAALYAARHPEVEKLVLLAPAFAFPSHWPAALGPAAMEQWRLTGKRAVFHYASGGLRDLDYSFVQDGARYEDFPDFRQPALICHGTADDVVPPTLSERFASSHSNASLHLLASGHELTDVLDPVWRLTEAFLF